ncbi:MAG: c-type cytochrome [Candidatus Eremiobacteraeota bacterium]|nr:c-type cytochrome [Candidatus Eremiobacteraeota bacterium]
MAGRSEAQHQPVSITVFIDDAQEPLATYKPPAVVTLDTTQLDDGEHMLRIHAVDAVGHVGVRSVPFIVSNGPGITVNGLRPGSRVRGTLEINVNAFGSEEPFDPVRAESEGPIPVWTWVFFAIVALWATWYGLEYFATPEAFANTPTYAANPALAKANAPATNAPPATTAPVAPGAPGAKNVAAFDYSSLGAQTYAANCQSCHGATGSGIPGTFPPLAADPIVNGADGDAHVKIVLKGLSGKTIAGTHYSAQMPAFSQLTDAQIAAVIDHERTSWGNHGPLVTPDTVKKDR